MRREPRQGILVRTCEGRKDYCGGPNTILPLAHLDEPRTLAALIRSLPAMREVFPATFCGPRP